MFGKTGKSTFVGQPVHINDGGLSLDDRILRARGRVEALSAKLSRLMAREDKTSQVLTAIDQTEFDLAEWVKRLKVAEYEKKVYEGGDV